MPTKKVKRKIDYKNLAIVIGIIIAIILIVTFGLKMFSNSNNQLANGENVTINQDSKEPYSIRSNATDYQKQLYDELKENLKAEDNLKIAESVAKNFVADFFTLSNKTIKNDVGGAQFFRQDLRLNFRDKAINSFYRNLELYVIDYTSKDLPTVKNIQTLGDIRKNKDDEGIEHYFIRLTWEYADTNKFPTKDLQNGADICIDNKDGNLYIYSITNY